jgi:hypothetical protein
VRTRRPQVAVITAADESPHDQLRRRQRQYGLLMLGRVFCLILAAVLVMLHVPLTLLWVILLTLGMVAFPWMAVLIANDRPPKKESRFSTRWRRAVGTEKELGGQRGAPDGPPGGAPGGPPVDRPQLTAGTRIIDEDAG